MTRINDIILIHIVVEGVKMWKINIIYIRLFNIFRKSKPRNNDFRGVTINPKHWPKMSHLAKQQLIFIKGL